MTTARHDQSRKLAANVLFGLLRLLGTGILGLISTRIVLRELGIDDYGLFIVVAAGIALSVVLESAMTTSVLRFLSAALGRESADELKSIFRASTSIFAYFAVGVVVFGVVTVPLVTSVFDVPEGREAAARVAFLAAAVATAAGALGAPYRAAIGARQAHWLDAVLSMLYATLSLLIALGLGSYTGDRLKLYAILMAGAALVTNAAVAATALIRYEECRWWRFEGERYPKRSLISFAGWNSLNVISLQIRIQVSQVVLNRAAGVGANASFSIARRLQTYQARIPQAVLLAARPAVTQMFSGKHGGYALDVALFVSRIAPILALMIGGPLILEMPVVLDAWLVDVPAGADEFAVLLLAASVVGLLASGINELMIADGRISLYSSVSLAIGAAFLPLSLLAFAFGAGPVAVGWSLLVTAGGDVIWRVVFGSRQIGVSLRLQVTRVLMPVVVSVSCSLAMALVPRLLLEASISRFALVCFSYWVGGALGTWVFSFSHAERRALSRTLRSLAPRRPQVEADQIPGADDS